LWTGNINRSKTAAELFQDQFITSSAGFYASSIGGPTSIHLTQDMIYWADIVFVFEKDHLTWLQERFPTESANVRVINLDVPDEFRYFDPGLIKILKRKMKAIENELFPPGSDLSSFL
jgi:predicted protein tyrosine phosphatase